MKAMNVTLKNRWCLDATASDGATVELPEMAIRVSSITAPARRAVVALEFRAIAADE
jgi:hypothetical protein